MASTKYIDYMRSPEWQEKRSQILRRSRYCEVCSTRISISRCLAVEVHHLTYARLGHEELSDLLAVCRRCHDYLHKKPNIKPKKVGFKWAI